MTVFLNDSVPDDQHVAANQVNKEPGYGEKMPEMAVTAASGAGEAPATASVAPGGRPAEAITAVEWVELGSPNYYTERNPLPDCIFCKYLFDIESLHIYL